MFTSIGCGVTDKREVAADLTDDRLHAPFPAHHVGVTSAAFRIPMPLPKKPIVLRFSELQNWAGLA